MSFETDAIILLKTMAIIVPAIIAFWLCRVIGVALWRRICRALLPLETWVLGWLQDRATARTLGIDIDVIRVRRKVEFPD